MRKLFLKNLISSYCAENGISRSAFGTICGVSDATLSFIENEKWNKISDEMAQKIKSFIDGRKAEDLYQSYDLIDICRACSTAREHHFMIGILADTGIGKTTSLRFYSRQKNVFYVSFYKSMTAPQFFEELLREMAISYAGNLHNMINRVVEELNKKENPLVIIDEASIINRNMMLYLRELRDKTVSNCGIILAGMPYFKEKLVKYADGHKEGCAEFLRRVIMWHTCEGLKPNERREICQKYEITDPEAIKEMMDKSKFGELMNEIHLYKKNNGGL